MKQIQKIDCLPIVSGQHPLLDRIEITYVSSFPEVERRQFRLVRDLIEANPFFNMYSLMKADVFVGFISVWEFENFSYIEHFAIDESARNGGIGAIVLNHFISAANTPIVLEVELPVDEMSKRRIGFYERLGFTLDTHVYYQPSYERTQDASIEMRLMSIGGIDLSNMFEEVKLQIYAEVYGIK